MKIRKSIYDLVDARHKDSFISRAFNTGITFLIILNVIAIVLESFESVRLAYKSELAWFELISVILFSIEYILRLVTADFHYPEKKKIAAFIIYIFTPLAIIDLLAILPFYLPMLIAVDLRFIRVLRLFRIARILKLNRYSGSIRIIGEVFKEKSAELGITVFITFILLILSSSLMYYAETKTQPEAFPNILESFWWSVSTLTTGAVNISPVTGTGKFISVIISMLGIGLVALPTGILSAAFMDRMKNKKNVRNKDICPHCGKEIN